MSLKKYDKATGQWKTISSAGGGGTNKASGVSINDIGSFYDSTTVEGALQEAASRTTSVEGKLETLSARIADHFENHPSGGGGGGGGGSMPTLTLDDGFEWTTSDGSSETKIPVFFASPNMGDGVVYIMVNNIEVKSAALPEGASEIVVPPIGSGKNIKVIIYAKDRAGLMSNRLTFSVTAGGIEMKIISDLTADYNINNKIIFKYQITCSNTDPIYLHMTIDGETQDILSQTGYNTYQINGLGIGIHYVSVYASSGPYKTKQVDFIMVVVSKDYIYLSSLFDQEAEYEAGIPVNVPYRISIDSTDTFNIELYINGKLQKELTSKPASLYWTISKLPIGVHELKIKVYHPTEEKLVNELVLICKCIQGDYTPVECVQDASLIAWFDATEKTNIDGDREFWYDRVNGYEGKLYNFNYGSNGWIQQEGKNISHLVLTGTSYVEIDMKPFADNMPNGGAIELFFRTRDCGNQAARVLDITDVKTPYRGVYVSTEHASFASAAQTLTASIGEEQYVHVIFNIDRIEGFIHIYVNGVSTRQGRLADTGSGTSAILESISHDQKIYIGSTKGENNFGMCEVSHLRIYDMPLSMEQCLQNYMSCIDDLEQQKELYDFNYSDVALIPTMYITMAEGEYNQNTHEFVTMTDLNQVEVSVKYVSPNDQLFGSSFESPYALMNIQGTSSKSYTYKNFNIRLKDQNRQDMNYSPYPDCVSQPLFCLKCNYMESTNAHNVGIADFVHHELYSQKNPAQKINNKIRATVEGFPIELYIDGVSHGIYDFNLDRYSHTAFGYDLPELNNKCMCYEVSANSNNTAGAFVKWTPATGVDEHTWYASSFQGIYPLSIQNHLTDDFAKIKNLISWVCDSTDDDFIENFTTYFDKESVLRYYLLVMAFGMVDSLGKNMKLTTFDGVKWYIQVYDCDTAFGLDNSGSVKYDVDMEMGDGQFNTDSSRLWIRVRELFAQDLISEYANMRKTFLTPENLKKYLFDNNIHKIPQRLYNYSTQKKYLDDDGKWIVFSNGNRYFHLSKWIDERFLYVDTLMQYYASTNDDAAIRTSIEGEIYMDIQTYSPMYVRIMWTNTGTSNLNTSEVKVGRNQTVRIYGQSNSKDQEIKIFGAHYIKSFGQLDGLKPTRLLLNNADRLIEIGCRDNDKLMVVEISSCKYLQEVDFTNCVNLGVLQETQKLELGGCSNLRRLYVEGTQITSITTNMEGGNLTEIRLPNSLQELKLKNQYSLKTLGLPCATSLSESPENIKKKASKISLMSIINCPALESFTTNEAYIGSSGYDLDGQYKSSSALKESEHIEDLKKAIVFGNSIANIDNLYIENSFHNLKMMSFRACDGMRNLELLDLPNLEVLIFGENCTGHRWEKDGSAEDLQGTFDMNNIKITRCPNIKKLKFHSFSSTRSWMNFANSVIDLTEKFPNLQEFSMNIASQGLETIILPSSVDRLFIKTVTDLQDIEWPHRWTIDRCLLKNIYYKEDHPDLRYEGIDLGNRQTYELELSCCPQAPSIRNINAKNIYTNPIFNRYKSKGSGTSPMVSITGKLDLSEFSGKHLEHWFTNVNFDDTNNPIEFVYPDWDKLLATVPTIGPMFQYCTNSNFTWEFAMRFLPLIKDPMVMHTMYRSAILQENTTTTAVNMTNNHRGVLGGYKYSTAPFYGTNLKYVKNVTSVSDGVLSDLFYNSNVWAVDNINLTGDFLEGSFENAFANCASLKRVGTINAPNYIGTCNSMFYNCGMLTSVGKLNFSCINLTNTFRNCTNFKRISTDNLPDLTNCTSYSYAFANSGLEEIELPDITAEADIGALDGMFADCKNFTSYTFGTNILPYSVTSTANMFLNTKITKLLPIVESATELNMTSMYKGCTLLTSCYEEIPSNVTNMTQAFNGTGITSVAMTVKSHVINMNKTFANCLALDSLSLVFDHNARNGKVTNMVGLADQCKALRTAYIKFPEQFEIDAAYQTGMTYYWIFRGCSLLESFEADMSRMSAEAVADFGGMFQDTSNVKSIKGLDLSHVKRTVYNKYLNGYGYYDSHDFGILYNMEVSRLTTFEITGALPQSYHFGAFSETKHFVFIKDILKCLAPVINETLSFGINVMKYVDPEQTASELIDQELKQLVEAANNKGWTITA